MKQKVIIIAATLLIAVALLLGCTGQPKNDNNGSGLVTDENSITNNDRNSNVVNNLDQFRKVKVGDTVKVDYNGKFVDGNLFDSSAGRGPLEFEVGAGQMIKGFDEAVIGMMKGEQKTVTLNPELAYGNVDPKLVMTFEKSVVPDFNSLQAGMVIYTQSGATGRILSKTDANITVDFNHELAGKTLVFEIKLISID